MKREPSDLVFKDVTVRCPDGFPEERLLMVLGGRVPDPEWLRELARTADGEIWAVDSGVDACMAAGVLPRFLIGDLDSASPEAQGWADECGAVTRQYSSDKDLTDFQLALNLWSENPETSKKMPIVTGCFGGRVDHLFSNLHTFSMSEGWMPRCMADDKEGVFLLRSGGVAELRFCGKPLAISLLPLTDRCLGVSIEGVQWPLKDVVLERSLPWAISNKASAGGNAANVVVRCEEGILGVYWCVEVGE